MSPWMPLERYWFTPASLSSAGGQEDSSHNAMAVKQNELDD
jgi:hypothetical protein